MGSICSSLAMKAGYILKNPSKYPVFTKIELFRLSDLLAFTICMIEKLEKENEMLGKKILYFFKKNIPLYGVQTHQNQEYS